MDVWQFVGRQREVGILDTALDAAIAGRPRVILLAGEPGIGKSYTAQEAARRAAQRDMLVIWGRCSEEPGAPPYWPWLQLIRRYTAQQDDARLRDILGPAAPQVAALDAELTARLGIAAASPEESDAAKARFRLFDSIAGFWRRAADLKPVLLVIDDLHRADVPSLRLLEFVIAEAGGSRLMLLGTYRDAEVRRQHPLSDTLAELRRHTSVERLLLGGFSPVETAQYVRAAASAIGSDIVTALHERTEGHPLFLAELVRDIEQARGAGREPDRPGVRYKLEGVRGVIGARLNRLTPSCLQVLQHAAVCGREFRFDVLRLISDDLPDDQCQSALQEAQEASLVHVQSENGLYQFAHALVRDLLYDELPQAARSRLHRRLGAVLERLHKDDLAPCLSLLAHHYHAAGTVDDSNVKAIEYATRAAQQAAAMQAHEEASLHYRRACVALPAGTASDAQRCQLLLAQGQAENSAGASRAALQTFAEAAQCARRLGDASLLARSAIGFGDAQWRLGTEGSQAVTMIREALTRVDPHDSRERSALLAALCQALLFANEPDAAEAAFREGVAIGRRLNEPLLHFRALCAILPGRWYPDRLALRIEAAREALAVAREARHPEWSTPYLSGWHSGDLMEIGDTAGAAATARFHLSSGAAMREPFNEAVALAALAMIATHEGRFDEAEALALDALRRGQRFDRANAAGLFGVQMFTLRRQQGRLGEVAPVLRQFLNSEGQAATWRPGLAVLHCELGAREEARELFERLAVGGFAGLAPDAIRIASLSYLAEVCAWLHDPVRAGTLYDLLSPYAGRNIVFGAHTASFGSADRLLGMLATTQGRWEVAQGHFEQALAFDELTGGRPWLARTRHEFAAMLLQRRTAGDVARARLLLDEVLDSARAMGMAGLEQAALELSRHSLHEQLEGGGPEAAPDPEATPTPVAGLSRREVQVLRLMAAGKTNQEIADVLFRSPNTVANHVRSILTKTGTANRAQATAFAARRGLLETG